MYYVDGTVNPSGRTAAAAITGNMELCARTPDHCSTLQTELVAIQLILEHVQHRQEATMVVHMDSRAGLQVLQQPQPSDNESLVPNWYATAIDYQPLDASQQRSRADGVLLQLLHQGGASRGRSVTTTGSTAATHSCTTSCPAPRSLPSDQHSQHPISLTAMACSPAARLELPFLSITPLNVMLRVLRAAPPPR